MSAMQKYLAEKYGGGGSAEEAKKKKKRKKKVSSRQAMTIHESQGDALPAAQTELYDDDGPLIVDMTGNQLSHEDVQKERLATSKFQGISKSTGSAVGQRRRQDNDNDASPPRRRRHDSDDDASPPRRARHDSDDDASPARRRRQGSDDDASPPRRPKAAQDDDASPPRKRDKPDSRDKGPSLGGGLQDAKALREDLEHRAVGDGGQHPQRIGFMGPCCSVKRRRCFQPWKLLVGLQTRRCIAMPGQDPVICCHALSRPVSFRGAACVA